MLDKTQEYFLHTMKCVLHPDLSVDSHDTPRGIDEWSAVFRMAAIHFTVPMVYEVIHKDPSFLSLPPEFTNHWRTGSLSAFIFQTQRTERFLSLYREFLAVDLHPLVVKGIMCRRLYDKPDTRQSSDEDLLIGKEDFPRLDSFLLSLGYERKNWEVTDIPFEVSYYHPIEHLYLEVHRSLFPEGKNVYSYLNREFDSVFADRLEYLIHDVPVFAMNPTDHFLYLLCHCFKHFLHGGFGIRQVCDILVTAEKMGTQIDWARIEDRTKDLHIYTMWLCFFEIGERYLGFDRKKSGCVRPQESFPDSEELLLDILAAGIYGKEGAGRQHSGHMVLSAFGKGRGSAVDMGLLFSSLYPGKEYLQQKFHYAKKYRWLLPVACVHRIGKYLLEIRRISRTTNQDIDSIRVAEHRIALLEKYDFAGKR